MILNYYLGNLMKDDGRVDDGLGVFWVIHNEYIDNVNVEGLNKYSNDDILFSIFHSESTVHNVVVGTKIKVEDKDADLIFNKHYIVDKIKKAYFLSDGDITGSQLLDDFIFLKASDGSRIDICKSPEIHHYELFEHQLAFFGVPTWI